MKMVSVARELSTIEEQRKEQNSELRSQTRKLSWVRVSVKMLGLGIISSIYDIQLYVSNDQAYDELSGNEDL
jgi:hypothetical protein